MIAKFKKVVLQKVASTHCGQEGLSQVRSLPCCPLPYSLSPMGHCEQGGKKARGSRLGPSVLGSPEGHGRRQRLDSRVCLFFNFGSFRSLFLLKSLILSLSEPHLKHKKGQNSEFQESSTSKRVTERSPSEKDSPPYTAVLYFL